MLLYRPHDNQIAIHKSQAKYRVVVAGRRFGKSALGLNEAIARAMQLENQVIWIILPLLKQAKEIYWIDPDITKYFIPFVQNGIMKKNDSDLSLHVPNKNSWIRLKGSDNPDGLRGSGLDLIIWDEVADVKPESFDIIEPALADSPDHRVLYIGTPKGLNWFHDYALKGDHENRIPKFEKPINTNPEWQTWHFTSYDNKSWDEGTVERESFVKYIDKKRDESQEKGKLSWFNQEYMASFEQSAGRFFPMWSYRTHVYAKPITPELEYERYCSIDWGRQAPMAWYVHAIIPTDYEGVKFNRIVTFKEVYDTGKSPYEQAQSMVKKIDYTTVKETYYDPSMKTLQSDGSLSVADQFYNAFIQLINHPARLTAASNKRVSRWAAVDNWMRIAPDGFPYWMITPECPNLIRTIPLMVPDENNIEDIDTHLEDHGIDSAGYFLQYAKWIDAKAEIFKTKEKFTTSRESFTVDDKGQIPAINIKDFIGADTDDWRMR